MRLNLSAQWILVRHAKDEIGVEFKQAQQYRNVSDEIDMNTA